MICAPCRWMVIMLKSMREKRKRRAELRQARAGLEEMRVELGEAYASFNSIAEPELLDACIFQISALRSRYDTALRRMKRNYF
jgi:hypothetical protein